MPGVAIVQWHVWRAEDLVVSFVGRRDDSNVAVAAKSTDSKIEYRILVVAVVLQMSLPMLLHLRH